MIKKELSKEKIKEIISKAKIKGQGTYGLIVEYDENTLLKIYYKDIFETYNSKNIDKLDEEIARNLEVEEDMKFIIPNFKTKVESMTDNIEQLKNTKSNNLIKGIATYKGYLIGVFLEYYKEHEKLTDTFNQLKGKEKEKVIHKISELVDDLYKNGICPRDFKEDNILIRKNDLDVKLIDLDDKETRFDTYEYFEKNPYIKNDLVDSFEKMLHRIQNEREEIK